VHSTVASSGQPIDGGVVSTIVIVCVQLAWLPQPSVAVHVRAIVPVLPQPAVNTSAWVMVGFPQLSEPVAEPVPAGDVSPVHSTVALSGQLIDGGVVSFTVIVCVQMAKHVVPSSPIALTRYVRVIVVGQFPLEASPSQVTGPRFVLVHVEIAVQAVTSGGGTSPAHCTVTAAGQVRLGGQQPCGQALTETVNEQVPMCAGDAESVTVTVTVVFPDGKNVPDAWEYTKL
jgi:hypothetical protein